MADSRSMPDMPGDQIRQSMREQWGRMAPGWAERATQERQDESAITSQLLRLTGLRPGQRALDVACGTGNPAFALAERVGAAGRVLGVDITEAMVEAAREIARQRGVTNVDFQVIPSEQELGIPDGSFDAVTCRCALMYMPDPLAALRAWRRALAPGGRLAVSTWGPPERCHFFTLAPTIIGRHLDAPRPEIEGPVNQFRLSDPEQLARMLAEAGYSQVETTTCSELMTRAESPEAWWDQLTTRGGPGMDALQDATPQQREAIRADAIATARAMFPDGPVLITNEAIVAGATALTNGAL